MPLTNLYRKVEALAQFNTAKIVADIINENGAFISGLLKDQLSKGKDGLGRDLTLIRRGRAYPFYSDRTVFEKERKGQNTQWVTYKDSGIFYLSIYVYAYGHEFIFDSDVPYFNDILLHSGNGEEMMHLSKENLLLFRNQILLPQLKLAFEARVKNV